MPSLKCKEKEDGYDGNECERESDVDWVTVLGRASGTFTDTCLKCCNDGNHMTGLLSRSVFFVLLCY